MLMMRLKIIFLSVLILSGTGYFLLYKVDSYLKQESLDLLSKQLENITKIAFDSATIAETGVNAHTYEILNVAKNEKGIKELWVSRSDELSLDTKKPLLKPRDEIEQNAYTTRKTETQIAKIQNTQNDHRARVSVPIIASDSCIMCHPSVRKGDTIAVVNAEYNMPDTMMGIYSTMEKEIWIIIGAASFIFMLALMFSIGAVTKLIYAVKTAITAAINGDFSPRVKNGDIEISGDIAKVTNRLLETLDKNISAIDVKIGSIFIYNKSLYNKNPIIRLSELISEMTNLFLFKNKLDDYKQASDIYRELQQIILRYIKYKNLIFAEIINDEITSGYKIENGTEMKVVVSEIRSMQKRFEGEKLNILYDDKKGSLFISTSIDALNVIDLKVQVSERITLYYAIYFGSKKELQEKEKSISRIYNYIRESKPIINNVFLLKSIEESSYTDPLTKAYNRSYLEKFSPIIDSKLKQFVNYGILMIDIDHFKRVNDTYGHATGDAVIVLLVDSVKKVIKASDKVIRYGGEEFVVVLDSCDLEDAFRIAEKIRSTFAMAKKALNTTIDFQKSISVGISSMPDFSRDVWECINQADLALYEAKESGRNRAIKYSLELKRKDEAKKAREKEEEQKKAKEAESNIANNANSDNDDDGFLESLKLNNSL